MNDQTSKIQPAMVHIDLSNVLPSGAYDYLAAFVPGLFFVICVGLANPTFVSKIAANLLHYPLSPYVNVVIALFIAFIIGNGFMMGVLLIQWLIGRLYEAAFLLRQEVYERSLIPALGRYVEKRVQKKKPLPWWFDRVQEHLQYYSSGIEEDEKNINGCLGLLAESLLETKYAVKREDSRSTRAWWIWYVTLARPTREELRGQTLMVATHATGWCGVVATLFASTLKNRYYLSFSILMIVSGLFHDFYLARGFYQPTLRGLANVRGMLREFRRPDTPKSKISSQPTV
jgi:hypothetical protein